MEKHETHSIATSILSRPLRSLLMVCNATRCVPRMVLPVPFPLSQCVENARGAHIPHASCASFFLVFLFSFRDCEWNRLSQMALGSLAFHVCAFFPILSLHFSLYIYFFNSFSEVSLHFSHHASLDRSLFLFLFFFCSMRVRCLCVFRHFIVSFASFTGRRLRVRRRRF